MTNGGRSALSAVFRCLSHPRRRYVLYYLRERGAATVEELSRFIVSIESRRPPEEIDERERDSVGTALHHVHLPKLVDALIAEYDPRSNTVRYSDPPDELEPFLDFAARVEYEGHRPESVDIEDVRAAERVSDADSVAGGGAEEESSAGGNEDGGTGDDDPGHR